MPDVNATCHPAQRTATNQRTVQVHEPQPEPWPLTSLLVLGALPLAVGCARLHARHVLHEWQLTAACATVELVVSELATNAIHALTYPDGRPRYRDSGGLPVIYVRLSSDRGQVLVEVWDANPNPPVRCDLELGAEHGRGLMLVDALCDQWSWYTSEGLSGKVVWAKVGVG
jgi:anti-sigma regulatory factor (Ser/Thr protein kinase)